MNRRFFSFVFVMLVLAGCFLGGQKAKAEDIWTVSLLDIRLFEKMHTTKTVTLDDGNKETVEYLNEPDEGKGYVVVTLQAVRNVTGGECLDTSDVQLCIGEERYGRMEDDSFLTDHNMNPLSRTLLTGAYGEMCFQVPETLLEDPDPADWYIRCGKGQTETYGECEHTVPLLASTVQQMEDTDKELLAIYKKNDGANLQNAQIVADPYGNAPLTALALFETEEACEVQVLVKGKTQETDISYTVSEKQTHHQVTIYGLYADYENTVVITAGEETQTFVIKTGPLPEKITPIEKLDRTNSDESVMEDQLYLVQDGWYTMFDQEGEIRWYIDEKWYTDAVSGAFALDETGSGFWFTCGTTNRSPYRNGAQLMHMTWLGKITAEFSYDGFCAHHSIEILPNGHLLYFGGHDRGKNEILDVDPDTGEMFVYMDLNQVDWLDPTVGNINPRSKEEEDWAHPNSIQYVEERNCLLLSLRNQHMLICLDYDTQEPRWILTPAYTVEEDGTIAAWQEKAIPYLILADETFDWFYCQHDMMYVSGTDTTMDFTIFDNGSSRYVSHTYDKEQDRGPYYSRMVRLRVDEEKRTVSTMFEFGREEGVRLYSRTFGSTQYLEENGHYLGAFRCQNKLMEDRSSVVEADAQGKVVSWYTLADIKEGNYRATAVRICNMNFTADMPSAGVEVHKYAKDVWEEGTPLGEETSGGFEKVSVYDLHMDDDTISLYGRAYLGKEVVTESVCLAAVGESQKTWYFPMTVAQVSGGGFYGVGIPLEGLAHGTYDLYIISTGAGGEYGMQKLKQVLRF